MQIAFTRLSDEQHILTIHREDKSEQSLTLNSREYLRHDLAHLVVELELSLQHGFWGSLARNSAW